MHTFLDVFIGRSKSSGTHMANLFDAAQLQEGIIAVDEGKQEQLLRALLGPIAANFEEYMLHNVRTFMLPLAKELDDFKMVRNYRCCYSWVLLFLFWLAFLLNAVMRSPCKNLHP
jgi:hypothetical protein